MSLETEITKIEKDALQEHTMKYPVMAKKKTIAGILDISVEQVDNLIRDRVLIEEVHFTRMRSGDIPMFYVPKVIEAVRPRRSKEKVV